nr:basic salivary proline-rich protein 1-like [Odocoileus virginianus texanus]
MCPGRSGVSGQRLGEGLRAAARTLRGPRRRLARGEVRGGRTHWGHSQKRLPRPDPGPKLPSAGPRVRSVRRAQPLDSARGLGHPPRPAEPPPAPPLRTCVDRTPDPGPRRARPQGPRPRSGGGRRPRDPGPHLGRPNRKPEAGPSPGLPAGLTGPRPGLRDGGRSPGKASVRGACGGELPPLPVVPERPRPPPSHRGTAPAGPRPAPAHWLRRARCRLRGPGAAADPLSALCLPLARVPRLCLPPALTPRSAPPLGLRARPPRETRRPVGQLWTEAGTGAEGSAPEASGQERVQVETRVTNGAPDEAAAKNNRARLGFWLLPFPGSVGPAGVPARLPRPSSGAESARCQGRPARPPRWQGRPGTRSRPARLNPAAGRAPSATSPQPLLAPGGLRLRCPLQRPSRGRLPKAPLWSDFVGLVTPTPGSSGHPL